MKDLTKLLLPENKVSLFRLANLFKVLSEPTRLKIVLAILKSPNQSLSVTDLSTQLKKEQSAISHQLRSLRDAGILVLRKEGRLAFNEFATPLVVELLEVIEATLQPYEFRNGWAKIEDEPNED